MVDMLLLKENTQDPDLNTNKTEDVVLSKKWMTPT